MSHKLRFLLASAVGFAFLAEPALAGPGDPSGVGDPVDKGKPGKPGKKGGKKGKNKKEYVGPIKKANYPQEIRLRPLTMAKGMVEGELGLDYTAVPNNFGGVAVKTPDPIGLGLGFSYGLAPTVDVRVSSGLALSPSFDWSNQLGLGVGYLAYDTRDFDMALRLDLGLQLVTGGTIGVALSAPMRYLLGDTFDIHGSVSIPVFLDPVFYLALSVNPGVGVQASEAVYLSLDTTLFTVGSVAGTTTTLGNFLPVAFSATYAIDEQWDIGARLGSSNLLQTDVNGFNIGVFGRGRF